MCHTYHVSCIAHTHRCMYGELLDWLLGGGSGSPQWLSLKHIRTTETLSLMGPTNIRVSVFPSSDSLLCPQSCNRHLYSSSPCPFGGQQLGKASGFHRLVIRQASKVTISDHVSGVLLVHTLQTFAC